MKFYYNKYTSQTLWDTTYTGSYVRQLAIHNNDYDVIDETVGSFGANSDKFRSSLVSYGNNYSRVSGGSFYDFIGKFGCVSSVPVTTVNTTAYYFPNYPDITSISSVYVVKVISYDPETNWTIAEYQHTMKYRDVLSTTTIYSNYYRGTYIETIIAEDGSYPVDGVHIDHFWYVKGLNLFPNIYQKVDGVWKAGRGGSVKVNGVWRSYNDLWCKVNGVWHKS